LEARVISSKYEHRIGSCCTRTDADSECIEFRQCDLSQYIIGVEHAKGTCGLKMDNPIPLNQTLLIFVDSVRAPDCSLPSAKINNIIWVGLTFNIIAGICFIVWVYNFFCCKDA
jgi:hypothetical protein